MVVYVAVCEDRHIDTEVHVFSEPDEAIAFAHDFCAEEPDFKETVPPPDGWLYLATYIESGAAWVLERLVDDPMTLRERTGE